MIKDLLSRKYYRAEFDSERRVLALTFYETEVPGTSKVPRVENSAYINIGAILRREGLKPVQGKVPLHWDGGRACACVLLEQVLSKKEDV